MPFTLNISGKDIMAISDVGSYANAYENLYVSKRNESNVSKQTKASETDGTSTAKTETARKTKQQIMYCLAEYENHSFISTRASVEDKSNKAR